MFRMSCLPRCMSSHDSAAGPIYSDWLAVLFALHCIH